MGTKRSVTTMVTGAFILLLLLADLGVPLAMGYHAGDLATSQELPDSPVRAPTWVESAVYDVRNQPLPENPAGPLPPDPTVEHTRETILARQEAAIRELNARMNESGVSSYMPAFPAPVLTDNVDLDGRVGGIGAWRVLGDGWRVGETDGMNGTAAFTMRTEGENAYATMDALLVSPAIDLSAYVLQTGTLPFAGSEDDQVNLIFQQAYNFVAGKDGTQVYVYTREPTSVRAKGYLLPPLIGTYSNTSITSLGGQGFTGTADWRAEAFDLSPWAGKTIWVGFRVATSPAASDPGYFHPANLPGSVPAGWAIDDVEVIAPAYGKNLKTYAIEGPSYRTSRTDPLDRTPVGEPALIEAVILNAAATEGQAFVRFETTGAAEGQVSTTVNRTLKPGEVWRPNVTVVAPASEGSRFSVSVEAWNPGLTNTSRFVDPTPADNGLSRDYLASDVLKVDVKTSVAAIMVDDNAPQVATARVTNAGNVPLNVTVQLQERFVSVNETGNTTNESIDHAPQTLSVLPGASADASWPTTSAERGAHALTAIASTTGTTDAWSNATYYVHASPPPIFHATGESGTDGWSASLAHMALPTDDDFVWATKNEDPVSFRPTLKAGPLPEVVARGEKFDRLQLSVRYLTQNAGGDVYITYASPVNHHGVAPSAYSVFHQPLPNPLAPIDIETNLSWRTEVYDLDPAEADGYMDAWSAGALEVRVVVLLRLRGAFYLDDLRLTGVPVGADASARTEIIRITGDDPAAQVVPVLGEALGPDAPSTVGTPLPVPRQASCGGIKFNCWSVMDASSIRAEIANTLWTNLTQGYLVRGEPTLWRYAGTNPPNVDAVPDRLVTPVLSLRAAADPLLYLDHAYAFSTTISDGAQSGKHEVRQLGFVEMQYRRDDGNWSEFIRLVPEGDYTDDISLTPSGLVRTAAGFRSGDGFIHPTRCKGSSAVCDQEGYIKNLGPDGRMVWMQFEPSPRPVSSLFRLSQPATADVDLTDRDIRLAFHVGGSKVPHTGVEPSTWQLASVRVTPVSKFATDAAISNFTPETTYDWRTIGLGAGTTVPVNITVRNEGLFAESFSVRFSAVELGDAANFSEPIELGRLAPDEEKSFVVEWEVPDVEGAPLVELTAEVVPTDPAVRDDDPTNDRRSLGARGDLRITRVRDVAIQAAAFPAAATMDTLRYLPITLLNVGNVPLKDLVVERSIQRISGGRTATVEERTWNVTSPLSPDPAGVRLVRATDEAKEEHMVFVPRVAGSYVLTVVVRNVNRTQDDDPTNDVFRASLSAVEPVFFEDFEERAPWTPSDPTVWAQGAGFRSQRGMVGMDRASGLLPPETDATVVSTPIKLSGLQAATLQLLTRYDLEAGYDGGLIEVSVDNETWHSVVPRDEGGEPIGMEIVRSNPITGGLPVTALSGESADAAIAVDAWRPVSIDLVTVPALSESVVLQRFDAPIPTDAPPAPLDPHVPSVLAAPWMFTQSTEEGGRWEIRNENAEIGVERWWSGMGNTVGTSRSAMDRTFNVTPTPDNESLLVLSWTDRRAGTEGSSWEGVGGKYTVRVQEPIPSGGASGDDFASAGQLEVRPLSDRWHAMTLVLPGTINRSRPLAVIFEYNSSSVTASNFGWEVRDITLAEWPASNGVILGTLPPLAVYTGEDGDVEDQDRWTPGGWHRVLAKSPLPAAPWEPLPIVQPNGATRWSWQLTLNDTTRANVDARLVTPIVDLSRVGGGQSVLRVDHAYDLVHEELPVSNSDDLSAGKRYQAGVVEIEVFNRTTGEWDAPRQLFAKPGGPARTVADRPESGVPSDGGSPYPWTLVDAGDTFQRFSRNYVQSFTGSAQVPAYDRTFVRNMSYAFSGDSEGFVTDEFDLTPYLAEKARFVFHAWSGPGKATDGTRSWTLDEVAVVGGVLNADHVNLRLRLGTDASILQGQWGVDNVQITGIPLSRSLGIDLDEAPTEVATGTNATIRGTIRNYGPTPRGPIAVGLHYSDAGANMPLVARAADASRIAIADQLIALGPFQLTEVGTEGASIPFAFELMTPDATEIHSLTLGLLEAGVKEGNFGYWTPEDDIPGRTSRSWSIVVEDQHEVGATAVSIEPRSLVGPGTARATIDGTNTGTLPLNLSATLTWVEPVHGTPVASVEAPVEHVLPGAAFQLGAPEVELSTEGNYTVIAELFHDEVIEVGKVETVHRVGRTDTFVESDFEAKSDPIWVPAGPEGLWSIRDDDAKSGSRSLVFGLTSAEYADFERLESRAPDGSLDTTITSPLIDLTTAQDDATVSFWFKSNMETVSVVELEARRIPLGGDDPDCRDAVPLVPTDKSSLGGRQPTWRLVSFELGGLDCVLGGAADLTINITQATGQGWRMDGFTVASGGLVVSPSESHVVADGGLKRYPFNVTNPGLVPKTVTMRLDPAASTLTPPQRAWVQVEPGSLVLSPGETATAEVIVSIPSSRAAFPRAITAGIEILDETTPFRPLARNVSIDFQPLPRADFVLTPTIDGKAAGAARVEEGIPHEISALVNNEGLVTTNPSEVTLTILDARGNVLWEHHEGVPSLVPVREGGEAHVVGGTWTPAFGLRGGHVLLASADPLGKQVDYDRANDELRVPFEMVELFRPDIASERISFATPSGKEIFETTPGDLVSITGVVRNVGPKEAKQVTVRILAGSAVLREELVASIPSGASYALRTNQIVGDEPTAYQVMAFTSDIETRSDNNAQTTDLPIYPPEIHLELASGASGILAEGQPEETLNVTNTAPFPTVVELSIARGASFASIGRERIALAANETRQVPLRLDPSVTRTEGEHRLIVAAQSDQLLRRQLTVPVLVPSLPAASVVVYAVDGTPEMGLARVEVENEGNVEIAPRLAVHVGEGKPLVALPGALAPGERRYVEIPFQVAPGTPPGALAGKIVATVEDAPLFEVPVEAQILSSARFSSRLAEAPTQAAGAFRAELEVILQGNAPARARPLLYGVPAGLRATIEPADLVMAPGDRQTFSVSFLQEGAVDSGVYAIQFTVPGAIADDLGAASIPLDLRRPDLALGAKRDLDVERGRLLYTVTMRNLGDVEAEAVPVRVYVDDALVKHETIDVVRPGGSASVRIDVPITDGEHTIVIATDAAHSGERATAYSEKVTIAAGVATIAGGKLVPTPIGILFVAIALACLGRWRARRGGG